MKVLQFKTQSEFDEWLNNHELFQCYDKDMNLLGEILGPDADLLVSFGIAEINMPYYFCKIVKELSQVQLEELKKNRLVKTVITEDLFKLSLEQRVIIKRLRKDFEDATKAGLYAVSNDDGNRLFFFNGTAFDKLTTDDDLSGEWKEIDGKRVFQKHSDNYLSEYVEVEPDVNCESIAGNDQIDFISWGGCGLPWFVHLKL